MSVAARPAAQLLRQRRGIVHLLVIIQLRGFLPALAVPVASGGGVEPLPASGPARPRAAHINMFLQCVQRLLVPGEAPVDPLEALDGRPLTVCWVRLPHDVFGATLGTLRPRGVGLVRPGLHLRQADRLQLLQHTARVEVDHTLGGLVGLVGLGLAAAIGAVLPAPHPSGLDLLRSAKRLDVMETVVRQRPQDVVGGALELLRRALEPRVDAKAPAGVHGVVGLVGGLQDVLQQLLHLNGAVCGHHRVAAPRHHLRDALRCAQGTQHHLGAVAPGELPHDAGQDLPEGLLAAVHLDGGLGGAIPHLDPAAGQGRAVLGREAVDPGRQRGLGLLALLDELLVALHDRLVQSPLADLELLQRLPEPEPALLLLVHPLHLPRRRALRRHGAHRH
eukprot:CAMPEP_0174326724 /NCGR_PEP_ID=MMETSP0810-20121108/14082_1 /TAXON_ID=73025 ORGANISM="Eutreptiella gymnastica-like, Strain CCMP1594" /NCGR_SAMPLE_ID=MMETSP0810 /ASSEMBLY_ACC=CAM_ASM_000659 /LENGTH=390 /DNA_ID=CAMNT_0015440415 /DNA_START=377 /DNA_END=1546 /DNA_ORIENTATION=-